MKRFGRKKSRPSKTVRAQASAESDSDFYKPQPTEAPLHTSSGEVHTQAKRSSRHTVVRRRENDNRTTNRELLFLIFKIVLIPVLIGGGFFALKWWGKRLENPSEKELQQWEAHAQLMDKTPVTDGNEPPAPVDEASLTPERLAERMDRWETGAQHTRAAAALEARAMYSEAIDRLRQALQFVPDSQPAQELLLKLYMRTENYADAVPLCIRLLEQDGTRWDWKLSLLQALQAEDKTDLSILLSGRMLVEQPDNLDVMEMAAYAYVAAGQMDPAQTFYKRILEEDPQRLLALEGVGYIYQFQGEWLNAAPYYLKLLKLNPQQKYYLALARGYAQLGDAGKTLIFLGQAHGLYGRAVVAAWLSNPDFDPVRESPDFRAFLDQIVGEQTRAAIEQIRRRELNRELPQEAKDFKLPSAADLQMLRPGQH